MLSKHKRLQQFIELDMKLLKNPEREYENRYAFRGKAEKLRIFGVCAKAGTEMENGSRSYRSRDKRLRVRQVTSYD